jgi:flagellin
LAHLPSDAVAAKSYGAAVNQLSAQSATAALVANKTYVVRNVVTSGGAAVQTEIAMTQTGSANTSSKAIGGAIGSNGVTVKAADATPKTAGDSLAAGDHILAGTAGITVAQVASGSGNTKSATFAEVNTENAFVVGLEYEIATLGTGDGNTGTAGSDAAFIKAAATNVDGTAISGTLAVGQKFKVSSTASTEAMAAINSLIDDMEFTKATETLTKDIEAVQAKINTARVQAGSQYAAMESAVDYTTDLTAQYELGFNAVNDVNFSMETAHLAKNQILQQAATAMLAQANQGQQGLLQLIQG